MDIVLTLAGFVVGIIVGLCGVGGGALMTPFLILYGVPPATAVGTDLLFAASTKSLGVLAHHRNATVQWRTVFWLALGSLPASGLSVLWLRTLDIHGKDYEMLITTILSIALILTALVLFRPTNSSPKKEGDFRLSPRLIKPLTVLSGAALGVLVTLSSVGAGVIGAAILVMLYSHLRMTMVVGTDIAHAVPLAFAASLGHFYLGNIDFQLLGNLLLGSLPGIMLGTRLGSTIPEKLMRRILGSILLIIGVGFIFQI